MNMQEGSENFLEISGSKAVVDHGPNTCSSSGNLIWNSSNKLPSAEATGAGANCYPNTSTRHRGTCYHCGQSGHFWWVCLKRLHEKRLLLLHNSQSPWSDIPTDILTLVTDLLPLEDVIRMTLVCKLWRQDIRLLPHRCESMPWVVRYDYPRFELSDFWKNRTYYVINKDINKLYHNYNVRGYEICDSKYGWLLLLFRGEYLHFVFYNPFQNKAIILPLLQLERYNPYKYIYRSKFMTTPTCDPPNCGMFFLCDLCDPCGHHTEFTCDIYTYNRKDRRWSVAKTTIPPGLHERPWLGDVAYMDESVFCIFAYFPLQLGMRNFSMPHQDWAIMDYSLCLGAFDDDYGPIRDFRDLYLVEFDGDLLLAVFYDHDRDKVFNVYGFDRSQNEWTRIKSLGNWVMILYRHPLSSIVLPAKREAKEFANMIFCNHLAFISETAGTWKSDNPQSRFQYRNCIFIEPDYKL